MPNVTFVRISDVVMFAVHFVLGLHPRETFTFPSSPITQCLAWRAPVQQCVWWLLHAPCHYSKRMTYRPSAALQLLWNLKISQNKILWAYK